MKHLLTIPLLLWASLVWSQNSTTGTIAASGSTCSINLPDQICVVIALPASSTTVGVSVLGTFSATLQFEESANFGASWVSATAIPQPVAGSVTSTTSTGTWQVNVAGMTHLRVRGSAYTSGTANVALTATSGVPGSTFPFLVGSPRILVAQTVVDGSTSAATLYTVPTGGQGVYRISVGIVPRTLSSSAWVVNVDWTPPSGTNIPAQLGMGITMNTGAVSSAPVTHSLYLHAGDVISCGTVTGSGANTGGTFDVSWTVERLQ